MPYRSDEHWHCGSPNDPVRLTGEDQVFHSPAADLPIQRNKDPRELGWLRQPAWVQEVPPSRDLWG